MPMQAWFPDDSPSVAPGDGLRLVLNLENPSSTTDTFTITPSGLNVSWLTVAEPSVTLFGGTSRAIEVWVHPPRLASTPAGRNEVAVRIIAESDPAVSATIDAVIIVEPFDDRSITLSPPIMRARRRAVFEILVKNDGNSVANCRLHLVDASGRIDGQFDPPTVGVPPGAAATVRLNAVANGGGFRRNERQIPFQIDASQTDHATATVPGTLLQTPTFDVDTIGRIMSVAAVLVALVIGWFVIARPWMNHRIDAAVDERLGGIGAADDGRVAGASSAGGTARDQVGEPVSVRLAPDPQIEQTAADLFSVEEGTTWYLTDLVLQNPNRDAAHATLEIDGELVYQWDLVDMSGINEFQPRITPIPVAGGSDVVFTVVCESVGAADADECTAGLLVTGRSVPTGQG